VVTGKELREDDDSCFVGRRREIGAVKRQLHTTRLLTLTGAGGVGKTTLAKRAAAAVRDSFPDGVALVHLADLEDGGLLESAVAASLGLRDPGPKPMPALLAHLADRHTLLVLDGCEHLLGACRRLVTALLRGAPRLRVLATSRHTLELAGEQVLQVPSLSVPAPGDGPRRIARHEAVQLLVDRTAARRPGFAVDAGNAPMMAKLAQRLDGIPLAIELAAVRLHAVPLERLLDELDRRFEVLTGGSPGALPRHQTLRATIDWSFALCTPAEQRLWARLSVFAGGFDLEAAEQIGSDHHTTPEDVPDLVVGLVDKSVLLADRGNGVRYHLLDTIRDYGRMQLPPDELAALRARHADYYHALAERLRFDLLVPDQVERYRTLQLELPNLRIAMDSCLRQPDGADEELRTATTLWPYWVAAGAFTEGRRWLRRGLDDVHQPGSVRLAALWADSLLALLQGDLPTAVQQLGECRTLAMRTGDDSALAWALQISAVAAFAADDHRRATTLIEDAIARHRAAGDVFAVTTALFFAASWGSTTDSHRAMAAGEECLELTRRHHAEITRSYALYAMAIAAWNAADPQRAHDLACEAAGLKHAMDDRWGMAECLEVLAWTAEADGRHEQAARALGAADRLWRGFDASPLRLGRHMQAHEQCERQARQHLGNRAFAAAFRAGARIGPEHAITEAVRGPGSPHRPDATAPQQTRHP